MNEPTANTGPGASEVNPDTLYYECHINLDPVPEEGREELSRVASQYGFRLAKLLMQKGTSLVPSDLDTFMTAHAVPGGFEDLKGRMASLVQRLRWNKYGVRRYKIEAVILDSRYEGLMLRKLGGALQVRPCVSHDVLLRRHESEHNN